MKMNNFDLFLVGSVIFFTTGSIRDLLAIRRAKESRTNMRTQKILAAKTNLLASKCEYTFLIDSITKNTSISSANLLIKLSNNEYYDTIGPLLKKGHIAHIDDVKNSLPNSFDLIYKNNTLPTSRKGRNYNDYDKFMITSQKKFKSAFAI